MPSASQRLTIDEPTCCAISTHSTAVVERLRADARVRVAEAAEPVVVVAEEVRVDGADPDALRPARAAERRPVVDAVPRDVDRDVGQQPGQPVDERGVVDPLPDGAGGARPGKTWKRVPELP